MSKLIRTIFIGTSNFAVPILDTLLHLEYLEVIAVVTQPDKPTGRKQELTPPPVKKYILDNHLKLKVLQPEKIKRSINQIQNMEPELIIVASYGQIIPKSILNYPKYKALNVHVSLLPDLRGAVPMPMSILKGYEKTGVTLQVMSYALDEGDIVSTRSINIAQDETTESLEKKSAETSAQMLKEDLQNWIEGKITPIKQDNSKATYCYMEDIAKEKAEIKSDTRVELAERMVRAFYSWPIAWFRLEDGRRIKVYKAEVLQKYANIMDHKLEVSKIDDNLVLMMCDGILILSEIQLEGKKRGEGKSYLYLAEKS